MHSTLVAAYMRLVRMGCSCTCTCLACGASERVGMLAGRCGFVRGRCVARDAGRCPAQHCGTQPAPPTARARLWLSPRSLVSSRPSAWGRRSVVQEARGIARALAAAAAPSLDPSASPASGESHIAVVARSLVQVPGVWGVAGGCMWGGWVRLALGGWAGLLVKGVQQNGGG